MGGWLKYACVFFLAFTSGAVLMVISHRVQHVQREITRVERDIAQQREAIQVLEAEWSFLNDPQRLEQLASRYLDLSAPISNQLVSRVDAARPKIGEEEVMQGLDRSLVQQVVYSQSTPSTVAAGRKPVKKGKTQP